MRFPPCPFSPRMLIARCFLSSKVLEISSLLQHEFPTLANHSKVAVTILQFDLAFSEYFVHYCESYTLPDINMFLFLQCFIINGEYFKALKFLILYIINKYVSTKNISTLLIFILIILNILISHQI
ncbi:hypothetical protein ES708_30760 [subsurface metagenome]